MKIGDKVAFVKEKGGGVVAGFQGKNIVLVADEDGFEIPMDIREVVVVSADSYKMLNPDLKDEEEDDDDFSAELVNVAPQKRYEPVERAEGDSLFAYLAFVPKGQRGAESSQYDVYYINDCNYYQHFVLSYKENGDYRYRNSATVEPNTMLKLETLHKDHISDIEHLLVQIVSYKEGKTFRHCPVIDLKLHVDGKRFYKETSFKSNDFFDEKAMVYTLVEDGKPVVEEIFDATLATELQKAMTEGPAADDKEKNDMPGNIFVDGKTIVIDLHAEEILDSRKGMTDYEIFRYQLDYFNRKMKELSKQKGKQAVFIHGKGNGTLRAAIIKELDYRYKNCSYQDAQFQKYGFGATLVSF